MKDTKIYTVYEHINNFNGCYYIGLTSQKPKNRWLKGEGYRGNKLFNNDILFYGWDNFEHLIILQTYDKEVAEETERKLIQKYRAQGICYNLQSGGYEGFTIPESTKIKLSKAKIGAKNPFFGKHHSEEIKNKISEQRKINVIQIDYASGKILNVFPSLTEATEQTGVSTGNICNCCRGKFKKAGGYKWTYKY